MATKTLISAPQIILNGKALLFDVERFIMAMGCHVVAMLLPMLNYLIAIFTITNILLKEAKKPEVFCSDTSLILSEKVKWFFNSYANGKQLHTHIHTNYII